MSQKQDQTKKEFIENLEKVPIISVVCEKMVVSRATIYRWFEEDTVFREQKESALVKGREVVNDLAESKLISKLQVGDNWSIRYWLENNNRRYMKREKLVQNVDKGGGFKISLVQFVGDEYDEDGNKIITDKPAFKDPEKP